MDLIRLLILLWLALQWLFRTLGPGTAICVLLVYVVLRYPQVLKIVSWVKWIVHKVSGRWKKQAIGSKIEDHINDGIRTLGSESPGAFPYGLKLAWISNAEEYAILEGETIVVRVKDEPNLVKPLVSATLLYLQEGVIAESRSYIERRLLTAVDLILAYRLLESSPYRGASNHLTRCYIEPALADERVARYYEEADATDQAGLLTRIVLREFSGYARKLVGKRPTKVIRDESVNFFEFVGRVASRKTDIPLRFFGRYFKCTVGLVARFDTYMSSGYVPYKYAFQRDIEAGMHVIYLLSRGEYNMQIARHIAKWAVDEDLISGFLVDRMLLAQESGKPIPGECLVCFSSKVGRAVQVSPVEEAQMAISQHVPESLTGEVEILAIAREPGQVTKVLVRSEQYDDPIRLCVGRNRERIDLIAGELEEGEKIDFVLWNPDPRKNVVAALIPLHEDDVIEVRVAEDSTISKVVVSSPRAAHRAVGTDGVNVRVAQRLLGITIDLETQAESVDAEEQLLKVLNFRIPEIREGKIEVVGIAREIGRAAKVAVRSSEIDHLHAACVGTDASRARAISQDLSGEPVRFIFWSSDDTESIVRQSLYPLQSHHILSVSLDELERRAVVVVRDGTARAVALGKDGYNVRMAEEICGVKIEIRIGDC